LPESSTADQRVVLISWLIVVVTVVLIAFKIVSHGFIPAGDARRHVAKVFTDKAYSEIVVMRPEYTVDHSPGWEWLLRVVHRMTHWNADALMSFSVVGLMLVVFLSPLPWLRRPEAWLAALLAQTLVIPELMTRFAQARPLLLTAAVLIALLFSWSKSENQKPSALKLVLTCAGFCLSVWMHGSWYLWVFLLVAFFLAGARRSGLWLTVCWGIGTVIGSCLTGKPIAFLKGAVFMAYSVSTENVPQWMLVGEFQPSQGEIATLMLLAVVYLWRRLQVPGDPGLLRSPVVWLIVIGWILGLRADRCWADWAIPAVLVWLTQQFEEISSSLVSTSAPKRLVLCALVALPLFFHSTNDLGRRYTRSLDETFLDINDPKLQGWMPSSNGIFYSAQMDFFYNTFYKNPQGDWRYILGFEPALMPEDDLRIFRTIQFNRGVIKAFEPWAEKMRPQDRLAIATATQPNLPRLEWINAAGNIWIGQLPK
jgi:hypothetical protein